MVGAQLIYPNGRLQEAGGIVWNTGDPWNYGRNANPHDPRFNYARQTDYLSGACVMLPLELLRGLGGFSKERSDYLLVWIFCFCTFIFLFFPFLLYIIFIFFFFF